MSRGIEQALAHCLERMERGDATLEEALRTYPGLRSELEPLLLLAQQLRALPKVTAPESLRTSRRPVFSALPRDVAPGIWPRLFSRPRVCVAPAWGAPLVRLAAAFAATLLLLGGTAIASAGSLPEEPLYPLKLAVENLQLAIAPSPQARAELEMRFAARRLEEVEAASRQGKVEAVQRGLILYEERLEKVLESAESSPVPADGEVGQRLQQSLDRQQEVLSEVYSQVPEQAQPSILHAMEVSKRGRERAEEARAAHDKVKPTTQSDVEAALPPDPTATAGAPTSTVAPEGGHEAPGRAKLQRTPNPTPQDLEDPGEKKDGREQGSRRTGLALGAEADREARGHGASTPTLTPVPGEPEGTLVATPVPTPTATSPAATPPRGVQLSGGQPTSERPSDDRGAERDASREGELKTPTPEPADGNRGGSGEKKGASSLKDE